MKRFVVACVGLAGLWAAAGGAANAADLPPRYRPVPQAVVYNPIYNWTGFYLGINGGGGWGRSQWDGVDKFDVSGGLIGGTIGYNWQFGQAVIGVEGDIDWSGIRGSTNTFCPLGCETRNHWLATARGASAMPSTGSCPTSPPGWRSATSTPAHRASPAAASPPPAGPSAAASRSASSRT
jgi:outer membrane immunogenic protein